MRDRSKHKYDHKWVEHRIDLKWQREELDARAWHIARHQDGKYYVAGTDRINGRSVKRLLHRVIMSAPLSMQVDHINGDTLDNRRCNLRLCTRAENQRNRHAVRGRSKYKGVYWFKRDRKWQAQIMFDGKNIHLGQFNDEEGAAFAYDVAARQLFGEFARLNFQEE